MNKGEYIIFRKTLEILAEKKKIEFEKDLKTAVDKKYNSGLSEKSIDYAQVMKQESKMFENLYKFFLEGLNCSLEELAKSEGFEFKPLSMNFFIQEK